MFSHIIIAWDGSDHARRAFEYGVGISEKFGARLQLVSVARHTEHAETQDERQDSRRKARHFYEAAAAELIESGKRRGVKAELLIVEGGHPAEAIVDTARKVGADLIIVGRRGLSGMTRFLMGSISDRIARYAHCPVLVIDGFATPP
ncbi:MAG TPA: universal stress protein [Candidatus Baltobacteraceae bacterium]|nr:universal stress protein [Candidatus Baltobacteraceae bacterium]